MINFKFCLPSYWQVAQYCEVFLVSLHSFLRIIQDYWRCFSFIVLLSLSMYFNLWVDLSYCFKRGRVFFRAFDIEPCWFCDCCPSPWSKAFCKPMGSLFICMLADSFKEFLIFLSVINSLTKSNSDPSIYHRYSFI